MAVIETWLHQDLQEPVKVNHLDGNLFSNNGNGNLIGVVLTNNGEALASISGTVSGYVVTADGSTVPCTGLKSGNRASILIPAAAYQPGSIFITVFVTDGTTVTTIGAVSTTVMRSRTNAQVDPGSAVTDWTQTINAAMQSVETAAANLGGIVAVPYASITFPVPLGKYTYYNNNLYRCISPIASSESFTAAHWTQVRLGDDVSDLKSALSTSNKTWIEITDNPIGEWKKGYYNTPSSGSGVSYVYDERYMTCLLPVSENDVITINATGLTGINRLYVFIDSSGNAIGRCSTNLNGERTIVAPRNAVYVGVNNYIESQPTNYYAYIGDTITKRIENVEKGLSEGTNNLFKRYGVLPLVSDSSGYISIAYAEINIDYLDAGTYSVRMKVDSEAETWMIAFGSDPDYSSRTTVYSYTSSVKNTDVVFTFTSSSTIKSIFLFSSTSVSGSANKVVTLKDFTIITGSTEPKYNYPQRDAYDHKSRFMISQLQSITGGLMPTGDSTDRKTEIEEMLASGTCMLSAGDFYVSGIDMPDNTTLTGNGRGTRLILLNGVTTGYGVKMGSRCVVKDLSIVGSSDDISFIDESIDSIHIGTRHGILWKGEATGGTSTSENNTHFEGIISNCFFKGFTGGAITCETTGYGTDAGITVDNCHMNNCGAGINIAWWSEFNRFNNCNCNGCYYGVINNGGNNSFSNCNFSSNNVGFYINGEDNKCILADGITVKTLRNGGHGQAVGCIIDHTGLGENLNSGYSVYIRKLDSGWMFDGCQIFYGKIYLNNSSHTMFTGINFGNNIILLLYGIYGTNASGTVIIANSYVRAGSSSGIKAYVYDTDGNIVQNNAYGEDGNLPRAKFLNVYRFNGELKNLLSIAVSE